MNLITNLALNKAIVAFCVKIFNSGDITLAKYTYMVFASVNRAKKNSFWEQIHSAFVNFKTIYIYSTFNHHVLRLMSDHNSFKNAIGSEVWWDQSRINRSWKTEWKCKLPSWAQLPECHMENAWAFLNSASTSGWSLKMNLSVGLNLATELT